MIASDLQRFLAKVDQSGNCWLWTGAVGASRDPQGGYGNFRLNGRIQRAHRVAYEHFVGPIPRGLPLDHICEVRLCVNPNHLRPTSHRKNILRGEGATARNARREKCPAGHPYDTFKERRGGIERSCSICNRRHWRESKRRRRAAARTAA